jgi:hypothetical protein
MNQRKFRINGSQGTLGLRHKKQAWPAVRDGTFLACEKLCPDDERNSCPGTPFSLLLPDWRTTLLAPWPSVFLNSCQLLRCSRRHTSVKPEVSSTCSQKSRFYIILNQIHPVIFFYHISKYILVLSSRLHMCLTCTCLLPHSSYLLHDVNLLSAISRNIPVLKESCWTNLICFESVRSSLQED